MSHFHVLTGGRIGGKAANLEKLDRMLEASAVHSLFPSLKTEIPETYVLGSDSYDLVRKENPWALQDGMSDGEILRSFLGFRLPSCLEETLKEVLKKEEGPLAIRSSSLLEDAYQKPFAGIYGTSMIACQGSLEERLRSLREAILTVYASLFSEEARAYREKCGYREDEEKMAVLLQPLSGNRHGAYFFPNVSGVARSLNSYPLAGQKSEDGIATIAFGFGKSIVDDAAGYRFTPKDSRRAGNLDTEISSQRYFYALDTQRPFQPLSDRDNLVKLPLEAAFSWKEALSLSFSTILEDGTETESLRQDGERILTFRSLLKYQALPLGKLISCLLEEGKKLLEKDVEIEFALNTETSVFHLLQVRPIVRFSSAFPIGEKEIRSAFLYSPSSLGEGRIEGLTDIVSCSLEIRERQDLSTLSGELAAFNARLSRPYILIVPGRLGSADPFLGIPALWSMVSKAAVIVETEIPGPFIEPSQGTHFFQNITSLGTIYLSIAESFQEGFLRKEAFQDFRILESGQYFTHYQTGPLEVLANGLERKAIISKKL